MKVAVTGGSGQLGTLIVQRLLEHPSVKLVLSVDKRPTTLVHPKLRPLVHDICSAGLEHEIDGFDALFHLAFIVVKPTKRSLMEAVNVGGSKRVFDACLAANIPHLLYSSSIAAYGCLPDLPVPLVEDSPRTYQHDFAYAAHKFQVEAALDEVKANHPELKVTRMRPSILIGRHMNHALGDAYARGIIYDIADAGTPLVWDEDVADAFLLAFDQQATGAFVLTADTPLTAKETARVGNMRRVRIPRLAIGGMVALLRLLNRLNVGAVPDAGWFSSAGAAMRPSSQKALSRLHWERSCPTCADVVRRYVDTR